jgi:type II secretory pathway pseudopilin PulG
MRIENKIWFTLVELIVVITILSVLSTIWFVSFTWYWISARDSVRLADIHSIQKSLWIYKLKNSRYPIPEDKVDVTASGITLNYQWYAGKQVLWSIWVHWGWVDPLTQEYYTYATNANRVKYQLLSYFEKEENGWSQAFNRQTTYASLVDRYPKLSWDKVWIVINNTTKEPLQESWMNIDITQPTSTYEVYISDTEVVTWDNVSLWVIYSKSSCKRLKENDSTLLDGTYMIDPLADGNEIEVYCDMTTDWWGWTLISSDYAHLESQPRSREFPEYDNRWSNFDSKIVATEILHINETDNLLWEDKIKRHIIFDSYKINGVENFHKIIWMITWLDEYEEVYNTRAYTDRLFGWRIVETSENINFEFDQISRMWISVTTWSVWYHNTGLTARAGRTCNYVIWKSWDCFEFWAISDNRINGRNYNSAWYRSARWVDPIIKQHVYIR